jgi:hypothetical protein
MLTSMFRILRARSVYLFAYMLLSAYLKDRPRCDTCGSCLRTAWKVTTTHKELDTPIQSRKQLNILIDGGLWSLG